MNRNFDKEKFRLFNTATGRYVEKPSAMAEDGRLFMEWGTDKDFVDQIQDRCLVEMNSYSEDYQGLFLFDKDVVQNVETDAYAIVEYNEDGLMWVARINHELAYLLIDILENHDLKKVGTSHDKELMNEVLESWDIGKQGKDMN